MELRFNLPILYDLDIARLALDLPKYPGLDPNAKVLVQLCFQQVKIDLNLK